MADWEDLDNRPVEDDDDLDDDWDVDSEEEREKKAAEEAAQQAKIEAEKLRKKQLKEQEAEEKRRKAERLAELNRIKSPAEIQAEQEQAQLDIAADMFDTTEVNSAENSIKSLNIRDPVGVSTFDSLKPETKADFLKLKTMIVRKIDEYSKHPIGRTLWSDVILDLANKQDIDDHELVKAVGTKVSAVGNNKMADWKLKNKKKKKGSTKPGLNSSNAKFTIKNDEDNQYAYNDEDYDDFM